jgi:hypothetical protein
VRSRARKHALARTQVDDSSRRLRRRPRTQRAHSLQRVGTCDRSGSRP